jgi:hypothetical protein
MARRSKRYKSRLERVERKKNLQRTVVFSLMTGGLLVLFFFVGLPLLIKAAVWWGNWRETENPIDTSDKIAPAAPRLGYIPTATNSAQLEIKGFTEEGVTVKITVNDKEVKEITSGKEGEFLASGIKLSEGENKVWATAEDQAGNVSQQSKTNTVVLDEKPPKLEVENPKDGQEFHGEGERNIEVKGVTEEGVKLTVNGAWVIIGSEGKFSYLYNLSEGDNQLMVKTEDDAGNVTEKELKVKWSP